MEFDSSLIFVFDNLFTFCESRVFLEPKHETMREQFLIFGIYEFVLFAFEYLFSIAFTHHYPHEVSCQTMIDKRLNFETGLSGLSLLFKIVSHRGEDLPHCLFLKIILYLFQE